MVLRILKQFYIFPFNYLFLYKVYFRKKLVPRLVCGMTFRINGLQSTKNVIIMRRLFFMFVTVIYFLFLKNLRWSKRKCVTLHSSAFVIYFCETNEEIAFYFYGGDLTRINPFVNPFPSKRFPIDE